MRVLLTILGLKGGLTFLCSSSSQSISLKKGWVLMASSQPWLTTQPRRLAGFLVMNCTQTHDTQSWLWDFLCCLISSPFKKKKKRTVPADASCIKQRGQKQKDKGLSKKHFGANNRAEALMALWTLQTKRCSGRVMEQVSGGLLLFNATESCVAFVPLSVHRRESTLWSAVVFMMALLF